MTVDTGQAGTDRSEPTDLLGFSTTTTSRADREWFHNKIYHSAAAVWMKMSFWCERSEETGQTGSEDGEATGTQFTTGSNHGIKSTNCEHTAGGTLKQMGYSSRRPHSAPPVSSQKQNDPTIQKDSPKLDHRLPDQCFLIQRVSFSRATFRWSVKIWCKNHDSMDPSCPVWKVQAGGVKMVVVVVGGSFLVDFGLQF